jgi:vacuolar-type H+-ATPase subunit F/Vma7
VSARFVVVVPPRLATPYRLAGAEVHEADAIHEPYYHDLPERWRRRMEPLLVALPPGEWRVEEISRRERLASMLRQAIGYHFVFEEEAR